MKVSKLTDDLALISGDFLEYQLPKSKRYLLKYYTTPLQRQLLRYYFVFGNTKRFVEHTGYWCMIRYRQVLIKKLKKLEADMQRARDNFDFELVAKIESGKHEFI